MSDHDDVRRHQETLMWDALSVIRDIYDRDDNRETQAEDMRAIARDTLVEISYYDRQKKD